jgi:hypothetical protein
VRTTLSGRLGSLLTAHETGPIAADAAKRLSRRWVAIEPQPGAAHILVMVAKSAKSPSARTPARRTGWYRGVKLQAPPAPPKTSLSKLKDAVTYAVGKNADALAGGK